MADVKLVKVGALKGPHGLKGLVKAKITLDDVDLVRSAGPMVLEDGRTFVVEEIATAGQGLFALKLAGVETIEQAEKVGGLMYLDRAKWPEDEGEVYLDALVGREVVGPEGEVVGVVAQIVNLPAGAALEVEVGGKKKLVPVVEDFVAVGDEIRLTALGLAVLAV